MPSSDVDHSVTTSKEAILDAAQSLLANHGYAGLSMRELAAESGLAKATIYHHFQDKNDVFRSVLQRDMTMVHTQIVAAADSTTTAVDKLSAVIRMYVVLMGERRTVIMSVLHELAQEESKLCEFIHNQRNCYFAPIATILEQGIAEGVFRPLNVEQAAISLVGMINAFVVFRVLADTKEPDEEIINHTINLFLRGVMDG
jgi:AcrR family transcriptional regulator